MSIKTGKCDCKLVMMGHPGVGKSALVVRYLTRRFISEYDPTLENTYRHQTTIDEEAVNMDILDTAGQASMGQSQADGHIRWGEGFILVYSITDKRSFEDLQRMKQYLDELRKARNVSCIIIGNKTDLAHERYVTREEGEKLAGDMACAFFETSASDGNGEIEEAFHEIYREVKRRKAMEGKSRRRSSAQQVKQVLNKVLTKIQNG